MAYRNGSVLLQRGKLEVSELYLKQETIQSASGVGKPVGVEPVQNWAFG